MSRASMSQKACRSDYVANILIGPRQPEENVETRPGDSGAIWLGDAEADPATDKDDDSAKQAFIALADVADLY